jgi:hypothetical protein
MIGVMKKIDMVGQIFGRFVISREGLHANCVCSCGKIKTVYVSHLRSGRTKSCGCLKIENGRKKLHNLLGKRYGRLIVVDRAYNGKHNKVMWNCLCDCGKKAKVFADYLRSGSTKSCGCLRDDLGCKLNFKHGLCKDRNAYARYRLNTIPELKLRTNICSAIRSLLKSKNFRKNGKSILNYLPYSINELKKHLESLWEPWMNWNNYGGRTNDPRLTWHIDHIKPLALGGASSAPENLRVLCFNCNQRKRIEARL